MSWNKKFTLTENHIKLLCRAYVGWNGAEFGAPSIDPKRPYGNSDVLHDMGDILSVEYAGAFTFDGDSYLKTDCSNQYEDLPDELRQKLGKNGREAVLREYTTSRMTDNTLDIYYKTL